MQCPPFCLPFVSLCSAIAVSSSCCKVQLHQVIAVSVNISADVKYRESCNVSGSEHSLKHYGVGGLEQRWEHLRAAFAVLHTSINLDVSLVSSAPS